MPEEIECPECGYIGPLRQKEQEKHQCPECRTWIHNWEKYVVEESQ